MNIAYFANPIDHHDCNWINYFSKNNHVIVIHAEGIEPNGSLLDKSIDSYAILPANYSFKNIFKRRQVLAQLRKILSKHQIQISHSMYAYPNAYWPNLLKFENHIITTRGSDVLVDYDKILRDSSSFNEKIAHYFLRILFEMSLDQAKYITSTSLRQQKVIKQFISEPGKLKLIRTGVFADRFIEEYKKTRKESQNITILSNRAMRPLYNIDLIVDAYYLLKKKLEGQKMTLVLINFYADNKYLELVKDKINNYGLQEDVNILPHQSYQGLIQLYKNADLVVMVPKSDGTPVTAIETMLSNKPLIMGNLEYDKDLFNENTVWQTDGFTAENICAKITEVLKLGEEAKRKKTEYAFQKAIELADTKKEILKVELLYKSMIGVSTKYQMCLRCILDTDDDPAIQFDKSGVCNYCKGYDELAQAHLFDENERKKRLNELIEKIQISGNGKTYDSVIGISGGTDSSYLAYQAKKLGLRPLVVHYDNGWNSELAVKNIENIVKQLDFDLYTCVNDWEEFKDIQLAFLKASVIDIEMITDQAIGATLYRVARENKIKYIITGTNIATEGILPESWYHWKSDVLNIKAIHKRFGKVKLKTYPFLGFFRKMYYDKFLKIESVNLLNYISYNIEEAKKTLANELGSRAVGHKHYESIFTRFYQGYILPVKFHVDKRKAHFSTLICSGQLSREAALEEMNKKIYDSQQLKEDKEYVIKKLGLTKDEFEKIMEAPVKKHSDYPSYLTSHYKYQMYVSKQVKRLKRIFQKEAD